MRVTSATRSPALTRSRTSATATARRPGGVSNALLIAVASRSRPRAGASWSRAATQRSAELATRTTAEHFSLPANRDAPRYARERVAAFDALTPPVIIDAQLVISEMVTNAVLYADIPPGGTLDVELSIEDQHLVI